MNINTNIHRLLDKLDYELITGTLDGDITDLVQDTRKVSSGSLFVCIKGANYDSHEHFGEIISRGAKVIVVERDNEAYKRYDLQGSDVTIIATCNTRSALGIIAAEYYDNPADKLKVIGVTGTKGKTTTTYMIKSVLERAELEVGLVGTIEISYGDTHISSVNTTPDALVLQEHFAKMLDVGVTVCVMEVSSQAMLLNRVDGFMFEMGIFTNISPDHIGPNEHDSFEDYLRCKSELFKRCRYAIINEDDEHAPYIVSAADCDVMTYGIDKECDVYASDIRLVNDKKVLAVEYQVKGKLNLDVRVNMPGKFSVYNSLCAICVCHRMGVGIELMKEAIKDAKVKGRIEMLDVPGNYVLMIDYAHNAMSLEALLKSLREYQPTRLVVLFGCGGDRAKGRRYAMGSVAARYADLSIITSDNPRSEEPHKIILDIIAGYALGLRGEAADDIDNLDEDEVRSLVASIDGKDSGLVEIDNRIEAIRYIMDNASEGDLIVLAGKGHEDYQIIGTTKNHFDEREVVRDIIAGSC